MNCLAFENRRASNYPLSRWYLRPASDWLASWLVATWVRPNHLTLLGFICATAAVVVLVCEPGFSAIAAVLALCAWFFDRTDGQLARRQGTTSAWGAWLDGNIDELVDVGIHVAVAFAASVLVGSTLPWMLLIAFLIGKYLFLHGLVTEKDLSHQNVERESTPCDRRGFLRSAYHFPANADVRLHLLVLGLGTGWLTTELAVIAFYYNLRWIVRYVLVARRLESE